MVTKWFVKFVIDVWEMDIEGYGETKQKVKKLQFNVLNAAQQERQMKNLVMMIMVLTLTSCSEVLLLSSIGGTVVSQSPAIKAYNGMDALTIMKTKKDIKKHVYDKIKNEGNNNKQKEEYNAKKNN